MSLMKYASYEIHITIVMFTDLINHLDLAMFLSTYCSDKALDNATDDNNNIMVGGFEYDSNTYMQLGVLGQGTCKEDIYSKTDLQKTKIGFQDRLMQVKSIVECSKGSILQYFRPSLSYQVSLRALFCLFLSGCFIHVLLYILHASQIHCSFQLISSKRYMLACVPIEDSDQPAHIRSLVRVLLYVWSRVPHFFRRKTKALLRLCGCAD